MGAMHVARRRGLREERKAGGCGYASRPGKPRALAPAGSLPWAWLAYWPVSWASLSSWMACKTV